MERMGGESRSARTYSVSRDNCESSSFSKLSAMLGDVAVEDARPAGDFERLSEVLALRSPFELSRLEKSPKKPGAMKINLSFFVGWKKRYKGEGRGRGGRRVALVAMVYGMRLPQPQLGQDTLSVTPVRLHSPGPRTNSSNPVFLLPHSLLMPIYVHILPAFGASVIPVYSENHDSTTKSWREGEVAVPWQPPHQRLTDPHTSVNVNNCRCPHVAGVARGTTTPKLVLQI